MEGENALTLWQKNGNSVSFSRIANVIGFLPSEVNGKSAYDFILPEDYTIALFAQKLSEFIGKKKQWFRNL